MRVPPKDFALCSNLLIMSSSVVDVMQKKADELESSKRNFCREAFWMEEKYPAKGSSLFHYNILVCGRVAAATIERCSFINLVSIEVVQKLQLPTYFRPQPYLLTSPHGALQISQKAEVPVTIGNHTEVVL